MSGLILCEDSKVKNPYPIPDLGISLHSAEELSYYICHYAFLLDQSFVSEPLLYFIGTELGQTKLEEKIRKWIDEEADLSHILIKIQEELHYYNESEISSFRVELEKLNAMGPEERKKMKADYFLERRKYMAAIRLYEEIPTSEESGVPEALLGAVFHNKGIAFAGLFEGERALANLERSYELLEREETLKEIYFLCAMSEELTLPESMKLAASENQLSKWKEEFNTMKKHLRYSGKGKKVDEIWGLKEEDQPTAVKELLGEWKQEYREMTR